MDKMQVRYKESLLNTPEPTSVPKLKIDYKALIEYARSKNILPGELSDEEKARFILNKG